MHAQLGRLGARPTAHAYSEYVHVYICIHLLSRIVGLLITYHDIDDRTLPSTQPHSTAVSSQDKQSKEEQVSLQSVRKDTPTFETPPIAIEDVEL